jgi:transcriptional regulator with XRE-family HTH domain
VTAAPEEFSLSGTLRRIRRTADTSQRAMAAAATIALSTLAAAEAGSRDLGAAALARAAAVAGLRLALLDADGGEVRPMSDSAVRDMGNRRFPAHLDTRYSEEAWWHGPERYSRPEPWYTFDRARDIRDRYRRLDGMPDDHQLPQPGDAPPERRAARNRAIAQRRAEEVERQRGGRPVEPEPWICDCPPRCAELEDWNGPPRHADGCVCRCDPC